LGKGTVSVHGREGGRRKLIAALKKEKQSEAISRGDDGCGGNQKDENSRDTARGTAKSRLIIGADPFVRGKWKEKGGGGGMKETRKNGKKKGGLNARTKQKKLFNLFPECVGWVFFGVLGKDLKVWERAPGKSSSFSNREVLTLHERQKITKQSRLKERAPQSKRPSAERGGERDLSHLYRQELETTGHPTLANFKKKKSEREQTSKYVTPKKFYRGLVTLEARQIPINLIPYGQ